MDFEELSERELNEIIEYGKWRSIIIFGSTLVAAVLSALMGVFIQGIIFWFCLCALRRYAGGYHADTQKLCFVISFFVVLLSLAWIRSANNIGVSEIMMQTIMLLIILSLAPVENKNHILDIVERRRYGKKTRSIAMILYIIYFFLYLTDKYKFAIPIGVAFLVAVISLVTGILKNTKERINVDTRF